MKTKSFVLIEVGNIEAPSIGVIPNITNDELGKERFKEKFIEAISSHFDSTDVNMDELPDLFDGGNSYTVTLEIDGLNPEVDIIETWIY